MQASVVVDDWEEVPADFGRHDALAGVTVCRGHVAPPRSGEEVMRGCGSVLLLLAG